MSHCANFPIVCNPINLCSQPATVSSYSIIINPEYQSTHPPLSERYPIDPVSHPGSLWQGKSDVTAPTATASPLRISVQKCTIYLSNVIEGVHWSKLGTWSLLQIDSTHYHEDAQKQQYANNKSWTNGIIYMLSCLYIFFSDFLATIVLHNLHITLHA